MPGRSMRRLWGGDGGGATTRETQTATPDESRYRGGEAATEIVRDVRRARQWDDDRLQQGTGRWGRMERERTAGQRAGGEDLRTWDQANRGASLPQSGSLGGRGGGYDQQGALDPVNAHVVAPTELIATTMHELFLQTPALPWAGRVPTAGYPPLQLT